MMNILLGFHHFHAGDDGEHNDSRFSQKEHKITDRIDDQYTQRIRR